LVEPFAPAFEGNGKTERWNGGTLLGLANNSTQPKAEAEKDRSGERKERRATNRGEETAHQPSVK
jgi:hypothetical protein